MVVCLFYSSEFRHYYWNQSFIRSPSSQFQLRIIYETSFSTTSYKRNDVFLARTFRIILFATFYCNIFFCYLFKVNSLFDEYTSPDAFIWNVHWNFFHRHAIIYNFRDKKKVKWTAVQQPKKHLGAASNKMIEEKRMFSR